MTPQPTPLGDVATSAWTTRSWARDEPDRGQWQRCLDSLLADGLAVRVTSDLIVLPE